MPLLNQKMKKKNKKKIKIKMLWKGLWNNISVLVNEFSSMLLEASSIRHFICWKVYLPPGFEPRFLE